MNFGYEENRDFRVSFSVPSAATLLGQLAASFSNLDNAKIAQQPSVSVKDAVLSAAGMLRGLD